MITSFTGTWILIYASKQTVSNWLINLNISNNTVICNDGTFMKIRQSNDFFYLGGGLLFVCNDKLFRVGKSRGSFQVFVKT